MDALLRATFSHRSVSFWGWALLLMVACSSTLWALGHLLGSGQSEAQRAFTQGQRILISINDGKITGTLAPAPAAEEAPMAKPEEATPAPAQEEHATPPADAPAEATPPVAAEKPKDPHAPTMPAARIPAQDTPQVAAHELAPPANSAPATEATPALAAEAVKPTEPAAPLAEAAHPTEPAPAPAATPAAEVITATNQTPPNDSPAEATPALAMTPLEEPAAPVAIAAPSKSISRPLNEAPLPRLVDDTKTGKLPKIGADGTQPWQAYGKVAPANSDKAPRIAILLMQVGLNASMVESAMALPEDVSISISPYAQKADAWVNMARTRGHEALLDLPMEPKDFPISDAGPLALSPREKPSENIARMQKVLASAQGYVGLVATPNEHFLGQAMLAAPVLSELGNRGVFLISNNPRAAMTLAQLKGNSKLASLSNTQLLDGSSGDDVLRLQLQSLENSAVKDGTAIGMLRPTPLGMKQLAAWMHDAGKRGVVFVPVSSLLPIPMKKGMNTPKEEAHDASH